MEKLDCWNQHEFDHRSCKLSSGDFHNPPNPYIQTPKIESFLDYRDPRYAIIVRMDRWCDIEDLNKVLYYSAQARKKMNSLYQCYRTRISVQSGFLSI